MCLRISKTLRPKFLSASGFQPSSKLESVENPGLQIPDAHVASDQRCCGGRMWLRGIQFPFSKGWGTVGRKFPRKYLLSFVAQAKCKKIMKGWRWGERKNIGISIKKKKLASKHAERVTFRVDMWVIADAIEIIPKRWGHRWRIPLGKGLLFSPKICWMSGLPGFYSLKNRGDPGTVLYNFKTLYTYIIACSFVFYIYVYIYIYWTYYIIDSYLESRTIYNYMSDSMNIDIIHVSTCLHRACFLCHPLSTVQPGLGPLVATQVTWASASPRQPMHSLMLGIQWPWVWCVCLFLRVCRVSCACLALLKLPEEAFKGDNLKRCMLFGVGCWRFMAPPIVTELFPFT